MCKKQRFIHFSLKRTMLLALVFVSLVAKVDVMASDLINDLTIKGIVKEAKSSTPLPGVTVIIKGTNQGTITDIDGQFSINASTDDVLIFRYIGYMQKEVKVSSSTFIDVQLQEDLYGIDEVVVTGYGVQKKSDLTGAVSSVSAEKLNSIPIPNIEHALQGMAAGVNIIPRSGKPGEGADIQIRGISSVNGTNPLVIIDGVSGNLNSLNPADIASIEVLKDASSAAIYGATGGNGVILVTTKKGTAGKMRVSANAYRGFENPVNMVEMMNAQEYLELVEELNPRGKTPINYEPDTVDSFNWQEAIFQQALSENYDVSISGGTDVSTFLFSTSLDKQ
ncbi:MAG: TonB-dependent receptor plug domain-containing protein, partial [Prolixibacteraceae bacterium]|nr:TonB-dependent receptor plug domain-containing protein [Prolixibacteraceae bacterium]